jgi:uncharacterized membrane protein
MILLKIGLIILAPIVFLASKKKNNLIGYRTISTLSNDLIWKKANITFSICLLVSGLLIFILNYTNTISSVKQLAIVNVSSLVISILVTEIFKSTWKYKSKEN